MKGWTPQAADRLNSSQNLSQDKRTPAAPTKDTPAPREAGRSQEKPKSEKLTAPAFDIPETHLIGPYALSRADGKHYPGRSRHVITGPASEGLTACLAAALEAYHLSH